jgi:Na+-translocating ferredoxin:NAD+ oxidoreductase RnfG subunit
LSHRIEWLLVPAALMASSSSFAAEYFTVDQVQKALFAGATEFRALDITLNDAQASAIGKASGAAVRLPKLNVWKALSSSSVLGYVVVDQVYGKHEFITYAVALSPEGAVQGVEVMTYNESYGSEIRDPAWRAQFTGKTASDALKVNADIRNIGGATLSSVHITDGVRRLLATFQTAIKSAA